MIFLVDGDNNIGTGLQGIDLLTPDDTVLIFHQKSLTLTKLQKLCAGSRANVQYIESVQSGRNSIDFQIITELGVLVGKREADFAYVISQDKGYEASIAALRARYADAFEEVALRPSIEDCLRLSFLLRAANRQELSNALAQECGPAHGKLLYAHLKQIFCSSEPTPAPVVKQPAPVPAVKQSVPAEKPSAPAIAEKPAEKPAGKETPAKPAEAEKAKSGRSRTSRSRRKKAPAKDAAKEPSRESPKELPGEPGKDA